MTNRDMNPSGVQAPTSSQPSNLTFKARERLRAESLLPTFMKDPGGGLFNGKAHPLVLRDPMKNLFEPVARAAHDYFKTHDITWWGDAGRVNGHLLSSQVACLNHLFVARQNEAVATALLTAIDPSVVRSLPVEGGFVGFEYIGSKRHILERAFTRGANCTSLDAVMLGQDRDGTITLFLIEWKYTETYPTTSLWHPRRSALYDALVLDPAGPFKTGVNPLALYHEPFYQMMRQTLLGHLFETHGELDCRRVVHVHAVPDGNRELIHRNTSPLLSGDHIFETYRHLLKRPEDEIQMAPARWVLPVAKAVGPGPWAAYLETRYGTGRA